MLSSKVAWRTACVLLVGLFSTYDAERSDAATTTGSFGVQFNIAAQCTVTSASTLDFLSAGLLNINTDATSTIVVQCTNTTPYDIGLDAGTTVGGSIATRLLLNGAATIQYRMYSDAGRTSNWGNTVGVDTLSAVGNGTTQSHTVYGRVPIQISAAPGSYTDTVTVTVTY